MNPKALHKLSYGLYLIGAGSRGRLNAQVANTVVQITSEPATVAVSINTQNLTHGFIAEGKAFSASILSQETPLSFIGGFGFKSGREHNKLEGVEYLTGQTGVPIVTDNALAYLEARVTGELNVGTHTIFVGELVAADVFREGEPMTYAYYHVVKRGTTPKTAPSYVAEKKEASSRMAKYECTVCGYTYDPELGDPDSGIKPGTAFEDIPEDWVCPVCGASKDQFQKTED